MTALQGNDGSPFNYSRRTTSDAIFDEILDQISSLKLKPGEKVSEGDIARVFEVSRQPVREAFIRLAHIGLLVIRPQRTTYVGKISLSTVANARFVRMAIEIETLRLACEKVTEEQLAAFKSNIELQREAIESSDPNAFRQLDSVFHELICIAAEQRGAYSSILECKAKVDRLCALSLQDPAETLAAFNDHEQIVVSMEQRNSVAAIDVMRIHMTRLDKLIAEVSSNNSDYFID